MSTTYVSPQIEELLGVRPEEYIADPELWSKLLHQDDRDQALHTYLQGRASGEPFTFEYRMIARDGRVVWFRDERGRGGATGTGALRSFTGSCTTSPSRRTPRSRSRSSPTTTAHRAPQPDDVRGAAGARRRPGPPPRHGGGGALHGPRRLQAGERQPRPRGRRRAAAAGRRSDCTRRRARPTWSLGRAATSSCCCSPTSSARRPPGTEGTDAAVLSPNRWRCASTSRCTHRSTLAGTEVYVSASIGISMFPHDADDAALAPEERRRRDVPEQAEGGTRRVSAALSAQGDARSTSCRSRPDCARPSRASTGQLHYQPIVDLANGSHGRASRRLSAGATPTAA